MTDRAALPTLDGGALRRVGPWVLLGVLPVLAGAYMGYRQVLDQWAGAAQGDTVSMGPAPSPAATAASSRAAAAQRKAVAAAQRRLGDASVLAATALAAAPVASATAKLAWPMWEFQLRQPVPPLDPPLTPPKWRLIGASNDGKRWSLIVLRQGQPAPEYYAVGQSLPGGYRIEAITQEDVTLVQRRRRMVLSYIGI